MVRSYEKLNKLEKIGLHNILKGDGWIPSSLSSVEKGSRICMSKKIGDKGISIEINHFNVDKN